MSVEHWRCFVAIPIGEALRRDLRSAVDGWRGREELAGLRWADADAWHVTLAFLGSIDPASVPEVVERLATVAEAHPATRSTTGGLGGFPAPARARVAWYGIEDVHGRLARLAADVAVALGLDASRPLRPHLTLARARRAPVDLRPWLASASAPTGVLAADRIELVRSHLGGGPARYETLAAITLGVPAGV
jgi:2'-5' RNA ligase